VFEGLSKLLHGQGHTTVESCRADIPVLPAMITATSNSIFTRVCSCQPHSASGGIGTIFRETHHFGARNHGHQSFSNLDFQGMRWREYTSLVYLSLARLIDGWIRVSQNNRTKRHRIVDILIAVGVPHVTSLSPDQKRWRYSLDILAWPLT